MKLTLNRKFKGQTYTIGDLSIDGKFFCNTIEDAVRELPATCPDTPRGRSCTCKEKVYSKTAIPAGTYKVTLQYTSYGPAGNRSIRRACRPACPV